MSIRPPSSFEFHRALVALLARKCSYPVDDLLKCQNISTDAAMCYAIYVRNPVAGFVAEAMHETLHRVPHPETLEWSSMHQRCINC